MTSPMLDEKNRTNNNVGNGNDLNGCHSKDGSGNIKWVSSVNHDHIATIMNAKIATESTVMISEQNIT